MPDTISELVHYVMKNGIASEQILFNGDDTLLTPQEYEAVKLTRLHVADAWTEILFECREALWNKAKGHPVYGIMTHQKQRAATVQKMKSIEVNFIDKQASCGYEIALIEESYHLIGFIWVQPKHRPLIRQVLSQFEWVDAESPKFTFDFGILKKGRKLSDIGNKSSELMWPLVKVILEAIEE